MTDGREFEWPVKADDAVYDLISDAVQDAYNGGYAGITATETADRVLNALLPYVKEALAAEYDRGYETALDMEADARHSAWAEGLRAGEKHERSLWQWQAGSISRAVNGLTERPERPENPYGV